MTDTRTTRVKVITQASGHLLSIESCRRHLEVEAIDADSDGNESHPDDALILAMLDAAVEHAEAFTGLSIMLRTYEIAFDEFPDGAIELPRPPFVELVSFYAGNDSDGLLTQDEDFTVDDYGDVVRLVPVLAWPTTTEATNTVKIRFRAGYSSEADPDSDSQALPASIRAAVLLCLGHLYANREDSTEKAMTFLPGGFEALLRPLRVRLGFA